MSRINEGGFADAERVATRLGTTLKRIRVDRGLSQEQVAQAAGIATYAYGCLERGQSPSGGSANPTLMTLMRVFHALEVAPPELPV